MELGQGKRRPWQMHPEAGWVTAEGHPRETKRGQKLPRREMGPVQTAEPSGVGFTAATKACVAGLQQKV